MISSLSLAIALCTQEQIVSCEDSKDTSCETVFVEIFFVVQAKQPKNQLKYTEKQGQVQHQESQQTTSTKKLKTLYLLRP